MMTEAAEKRLTEFWSTEQSRLVNYVKRLIEDAADRDGEDIVQDVILSVLSRNDEMDPIEDLSSYVYRSIRNRVIDHMRKRKDMVQFDTTDDEDSHLSLSNILHDPKYNALDEVMRGEVRERIFGAIGDLSDEEKAVLIETEFNGAKFRELSELWEVPMGTLLTRKSRAIAKIKESLADLNHNVNNVLKK
ncbi:MAG: RNA polymerase sigma factor [Deltaproteobacteria bacterium]|uniref:RNA polymerase sigma factor n=1 Tax=Candidatus Zymogenus saltonus TaxID=2844893 RepID=A0A9D8KHV9_9DELT|nr:RNA polymerase sigma factor [Candidatus Zymogenus saltonus]